MIFRIFKKELLDTLRDRRTLIVMIVIPVLIFPVILNVFVGVSAAFQKEASNKKIEIGLVSQNDHDFKKQLEQIPNTFGSKEVISYPDTVALLKAFQEEKIQLGVYFPANLGKDLKELKMTQVKLYYDATVTGMKDRGEVYMNIIKKNAETQRYELLKTTPEEVTPIQVDYQNIASTKKMIGELAGGILPYLFIVFGFIGCMYPAIDLFTGEKERGTIETLLTTPVSRIQILCGKMGVVVASGLIAATFALLGLFLSIEVFQLAEDPMLLSIIHSILNFKFIITLFFLLLPITLFFAGVMIPIAIYAKSFKEAQSTITPLNFIVVLPAMVGFFPGIEYNIKTACIPIVNVVLATKKLVAGDLDLGLLTLSFIVMFLLAGVAIFISYKRFDKETSIIQ
jgi:sodium transport system permease protein